MKKLFTLSLMALCSIAMSAQEYNLFDAADVDANGWLWFDTQAKIEKYTSLCDETNYKVDANGKPVQLIYADQAPDYPASTISADYIGAGTDGNKGTEGSKTGAIMLQPSSALMTANGGSFVVCMPSCASYSICYSCESSVNCRILDSKNIDTPFNDYTVRSARYASVFKKLPYGINIYADIQQYNNGITEETIESSEPIYVMFQSMTRDTIYIHGIKVMTKTVPTGINNVKNSADVKSKVYTIDGKQMVVKPEALTKGIYIVREGEKARKVIVK